MHVLELKKDKAMKAVIILLAGMLTTPALIGFLASASGEPDKAQSGFVTEIPNGYRDWRLVSVAHEEGKLTDIRAILGNDIAIKAYREGQLPFPDGTIIARIAWSYVPSENNDKVFARVLKQEGLQHSFVAGAPTNGVQFMIKDSKKYASTGGWAFGQFGDGKPASEKTLKTCFACHDIDKARDLVFTHYAP
jgi:hypothetical protein